VVKGYSSTVKVPWILEDLSIIKEGGIRGVAVKCIDTTRKADCEGSFLDNN